MHDYACIYSLTITHLCILRPYSYFSLARDYCADIFMHHSLSIAMWLPLALLMTWRKAREAIFTILWARNTCAHGCADARACSAAKRTARLPRSPIVRCHHPRFCHSLTAGPL